MKKDGEGNTLGSFRSPLLSLLTHGSYLPCSHPPPAAPERSGRRREEDGKDTSKHSILLSSHHSLRSVPSPKDRMFTRVFPRFGSSRLFLGSFRSSFASSSSRPNRTEPFGRGR